jgi:hypothetical protein
MNDNSRTQGWAICGGALGLGFLFLIGFLSGSYLALAIPVAIITFFALGLVAWVGYTIATVQVEPELPVEPPASETQTSTSA